MRVAIAKRLNYALAHYNLGVMLGELDRFEEAEEHLRRAITLDPRDTEALYSLAALRIDQQRYDEALEHLQHLIGIEPGYAKGLDAIGAVFFYLGRYDEAPQRFDQALSLDPTLENARANREAVLEAMEAIQD